MQLVQNVLLINVNLQWPLFYKEHIDKSGGKGHVNCQTWSAEPWIYNPPDMERSWHAADVPMKSTSCYWSQVFESNQCQQGDFEISTGSDDGIISGVCPWWESVFAIVRASLILYEEMTLGLHVNATTVYSFLSFHVYVSYASTLTSNDYSY